jgi:uncharacterized membrane protein YkgB
MMSVNIANSINKYSLPGLRISLGICFLWFGILKFFPGCSPACEIAATTINKLTFGLLSETFSIYSLAVFECAIGLSLMLKFRMKISLWLLIGHMLFTFSTFLIVPEVVLGAKSYALTIEGQYVIKNIVFIFAAMAVMSQYFVDKVAVNKPE